MSTHQKHHHHTYEHKAMATEFHLRIFHDRAEYARQAAMEAFRECDRLEEELSRFVEASSISRLNNTSPGTDTPIHSDAYLCLRQSLHIEAVTNGAFDTGFRSRPVATPYAPAVALSEEAIRAAVLRPDPQIDLGGIGKGYALDRMAALLDEWGIESALLSGGWSTLLAMGPPPGESGWIVSTGTGDCRLLPGWAVSASGFAVQEAHVRDPKTGEKADRYERTWAIAPSAAVSDALSTAFLVLDESAIGQLLDQFPDAGAILLHKDGTSAVHGFALPEG